MAMHYLRETDTNDPWALPTIWIVEMTAREVAETMQDTVWEYMRLPMWRLSSMNTKTREAMFETMIDAEAINGGWMWCVCAPGCLPDSDWTGPFETETEALASARETLLD